MTSFGSRREQSGHGAVDAQDPVRAVDQRDVVRDRVESRRPLAGNPRNPLRDMEPASRLRPLGSRFRPSFAESPTLNGSDRLSTTR